MRALCGSRHRTRRVGREVRVDRRSKVAVGADPGGGGARADAEADADRLAFDHHTPLRVRSTGRPRRSAVDPRATRSGPPRLERVVELAAGRPRDIDWLVAVDSTQRDPRADPAQTAVAIKPRRLHDRRPRRGPATVAPAARSRARRMTNRRRRNHLVSRSTRMVFRSAGAGAGWIVSSLAAWRQTVARRLPPLPGGRDGRRTLGRFVGHRQEGAPRLPGGR
jgi:hypothetical protein